jgi:hypothetical protein
VLIAIQNPGPFAKGALTFVDAFYDIRHSYNNKIPAFSISGFGGANPVTIQNLPEQQAGMVYSAGDGTYVPVNYATEATTAPISGLSGLSSSIFANQNLQYVFAANQQNHVLTVIDRTQGKAYYLNLPGIFRISVNPAGTVVLGFIENSNQAYSIFRLQANQPAPANAVDCEPQNLPVYCAIPVTDKSGAPINFDRPIKAIFSPDGATAFVLNCGPECGGVQSSVSYLPIAGNIIQSGTVIPPGADTDLQATVPVPGGAYNALANGNNLYVAGQQKQPDGLFSGFLSILDTPSQRVTNSFGISDGAHTKMILADDNTLWVGSNLCQEGERYKLSQTAGGTGVASGCLTMFNTATNTVTLDSYKGDATGIAAVTLLHKVYVAEGGQVQIYSTVDGHALDNSQVTVNGTAYDVAYMDGGSDGNNTTY